MQSVGPYENILLIKPSSLGDVVMALPALSALRRSFPQARISWLIRPEFAPLIEGHPHLDEIILFNRKLLARLGTVRRQAAIWSLSLPSCVASRFDAVLDLQGLVSLGLSGLAVRLPAAFRSRTGGRWRTCSTRPRSRPGLNGSTWSTTTSSWSRPWGPRTCRAEFVAAGKAGRGRRGARPVRAASHRRRTAMRWSSPVPPRPASVGRRSDSPLWSIG